MNWKSTAVLSGAGVLATWFASSPPRQAVDTPRTPPPQHAATSQTATDITEQAERLRARVQTATSYQEPSRDPFRFRQRSRPASSGGASSPSITDEPTPPADGPSSPSLRIMLSGIAENGSGDSLVRTAIVSTPQEVFLLKEGEEFANLYRVVRITANSVELARLDDGSAVRLDLKP